MSPEDVAAKLRDEYVASTGDTDHAEDALIASMILMNDPNLSFVVQGNVLGARQGGRFVLARTDKFTILDIYEVANG